MLEKCPKNVPGTHTWRYEGETAYCMDCGKKDKPMPETAKAAEILADFFASTVTKKLEQGYTDLYFWEREALEWLHAWRLTDGDSLINAWTQSYLRYGPPPWPSRDTDVYRANETHI